MTERAKSDPIGFDLNMSHDDMIRGLVRAAEMIEQRDGGEVWDDTVRRALATARSRGWGTGASKCDCVLGTRAPYAHSTYCALAAHRGTR